MSQAIVFKYKNHEVFKASFCDHSMSAVVVHCLLSALHVNTIELVFIKLGQNVGLDDFWIPFVLGHVGSETIRLED